MPVIAMDFTTNGMVGCAVGSSIFMCSTDSGLTWVQSGFQDNNYEPFAYGVYMFDDLSGIVAGNNIDTTVDNGTTWSPTFQIGGQSLGIQGFFMLADESAAFAYDNQGNIYSTSAVGTGHPQALNYVFDMPPGPPDAPVAAGPVAGCNTNWIQGAWFFSATSGIAVGRSGSIYQLSFANGAWGSTCVSGSLNPTPGAINSISCRSATTCIATANRGQILTTTNGGNIWSYVSQTHQASFIRRHTPVEVAVGPDGELGTA